ncbi:MULTISPECIES: serine/threonine protein kinase [Fischerella]|uniref:non-specific serine/threonine protein kinase n=1 Tax=Fischerella muscicola CCMEE 5323 TaxID=2019572 RepID=A0A2N6JWR4_FISMU|nr:MULTISPECIES: serine/threonine protein kinase [Fischerella]MBD2431104.1 protein kinase [Fischerella sp. FACHB-380]PLZ84549.1 serine/threonine protein kinase [Fischerella muscicola CCMEE 5323]
MIGKLLDHRYQVIRVLATGGFGETYIAEDTKRPGNPVCVVKHLKPLSTDPSLFDTAKRLFHSEAETLEKLGNHDQIPRLLAYFDENQEFYLVQEFIEGHPLNDELVPDETWTEGEVIDLLIEVLSILEFVHSQGVIHRDIKPDNIIRRACDNKLVLVDFGAVKKLRSASGYAPGLGGGFSATVAIGTPGYMPTEQGQGKPRPNSDIYALGIIAIQALTGVAPIDLQEDTHTGEILWQDLVPVNQNLAAVLNKMVRYHFKDRYQTATEALQALHSLGMRSQPVANPRNSSYQPIKSPSVQSQQKTLAVAPVNHAVLKKPAAPQPTPIPRGSHSPDLLQLCILVVLAGSAAAVAPAVVKNVQNFTTSFFASSDASANNCFVEIGANKANLRYQPNAIANGNIIETVSSGKKLEVTGKRTKRGWVEVKIDPKNSAWIYSDVIKNKEEWVSCLRDRGLAVKTVDDNTVIASRPLPRSKPVVDVETSPVETSDSEKPQNKTSSKSATELLEEAKQEYETGDLDRAIELLKSIPLNASDFKETTEMITQWQQDWTKSEALFNEINKALDNGQWDKVLAYKDQPEKLPNIEYWRNKIEPLFKQAADNRAKEKTTNPTVSPR